LNRILPLLACLLLAALAQAQEKPLAITGARIIPISGPDIANGVLLIREGKIIAIGDAQAVTLPEDATTIDAKGKVVMPGLVDTHSHIGGIGGADGSGPIQPDCRVLDSLSVLDSGFRRAVAGGLTTLNIMPGSGHLMSGQTIYAKLRKAKKIDDIFILDKDGHMMNGLKMANGTNSIGAPPFSGTRSKSAALVREEYVKAQEYKKKMEVAATKNDPDKTPARDIGLDFLSEVLDGKRIVHHHTHRADDIMTVLRLQKEFGFRVVLHHVSEAWKVADEIAAAKAPCSVIVIDSPGGKLEAAEMSWATGGILEKAGVKVAFHTDDWITDSRLFLRSAGLAVRAGMSRAGALRALTLSGAEMLDLGDRIGSLEVGKDADFIILSGDPLSVYTHIEQTWVEGNKVFDRTVPDDYLHAVGGYGAGKDQRPYMCCAGGFVFGGQQWGMSNYSDSQGGGQ
jgi:imidazolonepropionase-like amidohydrolase